MLQHGKGAKKVYSFISISDDEVNVNRYRHLQVIRKNTSKYKTTMYQWAPRPGGAFLAKFAYKPRLARL